MFIRQLLIAGLVLAACGRKDTNLTPDSPWGEDALDVDAFSCPGFGEELCSGTCVNTQVNPSHCGACNVACGAQQVCLSNGCADGCPAPLSECAQTCVDTDSDNANCGSCGNACSMGMGCVDGDCVPAVPVGPDPAKCVGGGAPIVVDTGTAATCTGGLVQTAFTYGLCACNDIGVPAISAQVSVDAYDSTTGPYVPGGSGGSVGANDSISMTSNFTVTGDLRTTGVPGLTVRGTTIVGKSLHVANALDRQAVLSVGLDAFVGAITGSSPASVTGALHTPSCSPAPSSFTFGSCVAGAVSVPPPCRCAPSELIPIQALVAHYAIPANNDNALIGLDPDVYANPAPGRLELPCGYYYLSRINAAQETTIGVHGRTAIFIGGSISAGSALTFTLTPGSTLDVFVGGTLFAGAQLTVGTPAYPTETRYWVGGTCAPGGASCQLNGDCCSLACTGGTCAPDGTTNPPFSVNLTSNNQLAGLFYAPNGMVVTSSDLEMYGAIFAGDYHSSSSTLIHYDRAALKEECPGTPPTTCASCADCGNQACVGGTCGACTTDADCCQPLYCLTDGTCGAVIF
jgi:hypothetical protein